MLHMIGIILTMLYGGFLIFSAYRIGVQVETWITALNVIVGALMILTLVQLWLGIIGLILALPVALINGQLIFFNINWNHFIIRIIITIGLIVMMLK
ncbi:hypothetical protein [Pediococcus pentosaceus]|uniref:hypothetical protein n=1 Tax=Pediococcus pentosaceus TaxID=1255 RepID=UPI000CFEB288|nr:hypothetical protein [Pediococcus pentosaceus]AVL02173.1 hypothetical protein PP40703_04870 [Pediococcus pentosaceus]MBF7134295.1 hypothetical protein [Pediococcus pentosaceus]QPT36298.1 hypothetical protein I6G30_08435 [Pediococcus pentosaceus]